MKNLIKKFLKLLKTFINLVSPEKKFSLKQKTIFELYSEDEKVKCYNHFKKYFKQSQFKKLW